MNEIDPDFRDDEEVEIEAIGVEVDEQPIELYKVLKIANAVSGGGEAKYAITEGYVAVNGEIEVRKRRKLYDGDLIEFNQEYYLLICDAPVTEKAVIEPKKANKPKAEAKSQCTDKKAKKKQKQEASPSAKKQGIDKSTKKSVDEEPKPKPGGRGAIKFF